MLRAYGKALVLAQETTNRSTCVDVSRGRYGREAGLVTEQRVESELLRVLLEVESVLYTQRDRGDESC